MSKFYIICLTIASIVCVGAITFKKDDTPKVKEDNVLLDTYREYYRIADSLIWDIKDADLNPIFGKYLEVRENVVFGEYKHSGKW